MDQTLAKIFTTVFSSEKELESYKVALFKQDITHTQILNVLFKELDQSLCFKLSCKDLENFVRLHVPNATIEPKAF